ncbi:MULTISPECIES: anti-repressor SinI family protein [unclassified Virgibacillus]|nr:anti-repressor SinI family protein [Virgibacillus sp. LDC-1]
MESIMGKVVLDEEWIMLIKEAKAVGLSVEDVRLFIEENKSCT